MKKIIFTFLLTIFINVIYSQTTTANLDELYENNYNPDEVVYFKDLNSFYINFVGTWTYQNGNQTFVLQLWKETKNPYPNSTNPKKYVDDIKGHYKLVENYNTPNETIIYTSQKNIGLSSTVWPSVILARSTADNVLGGQIYDVSSNVVNPNYQLGIKGCFKMILNPTSPLTCQWSINTCNAEFFDPNQPHIINLPSNVVLTKQP